MNEDTRKQILTEQQTPTPIDPADIRPGDVVERALIDRITVTQHEGWAIRGCREDGSKAGLGILGPECVTTTWHLVHRPDPDAEAVEALLDAGARAADTDRPHDEDDYRITRKYLAALREQGWDVVRRADQ